MKKILICFFVCMLMSISIGVSVEGTVLPEQVSYPLTTGNILYVGGSGPNNYTKIQDAINDASNGDTVFVYDDSSPYYENVIVDKSITLIGEDKQTTILCCVGINQAPLLLQADGVSVQGFTLAHSFRGIRIESDHCSIEENIVTKNVMGIQIFMGNHTQVKGNVIINNSVGVVIVFTQGNVVSGNIISWNEYHGVNLMTDGVLVTLNNISNNGQDGVKIGGNNNTIQKNTIVNNGLFGISIYNSKKNSILQNNIYNNKWGNARVDVDLWIVLLGRPFDHTWEGNYWGRSYQGPKAILGCKYFLVPTMILQWVIHKFIVKSYDVVIPVGIFIPIIKFDWHPAQEPYDIPGMT